MKIFVAIPAYDRKICCETARALLEEQGVATAAGIDMAVNFVPGCSLVATARDHAARDFMASDADRMIFLDSDVSWELGGLIKIALAKPDFVGGCYRYKDETEGYPIHWLDRPELWADPETGLLEVKSLPGGFLSLSRTVFERLADAHPARTYQFHGHTFRAFFHCPPGSGEDGAFCDDWRAIGGQIWLDPMLRLTHVDGARAYTGCIGDWLRNRPQPLGEAA